LVVAGEQDRQDPLEQHQREVLPRIPGAKLQVIPECGHLVPIDRPDQLANAIRTFVISID
jgi:3-oxoadipate enol-lactonase